MAKSNRSSLCWFTAIKARDWLPGKKENNDLFFMKKIYATEKRENNNFYPKNYIKFRSNKRYSWLNLKSITFGNF